MSSKNQGSGCGSGKGAPQGASKGTGNTGSVSKSGNDTMKAPGQDFQISRSAFEKDPAGYFRENREKK
ncbi:hypothetical protein JCGZ_15749 [Jatropha curcas]|uniref:Uncharacterized protein n=1 Tax=Jatropha curcas TaxID=180498 RepID=A0A067KYW5_JATCU|nr:hypothetical protein JCGZ_15749 [Jatropha curcas]